MFSSCVYGINGYDPKGHFSAYLVQLVTKTKQDATLSCWQTSPCMQMNKSMRLIILLRRKVHWCLWQMKCSSRKITDESNKWAGQQWAGEQNNGFWIMIDRGTAPSHYSSVKGWFWKAGRKRGQTNIKCSMRIECSILNIKYIFIFPFRLCTLTLTRLVLNKPLGPDLTSVIIAVKMQVRNKIIVDTQEIWLLTFLSHELLRMRLKDFYSYLNGPAKVLKGPFEKLKRHSPPFVQCGSSFWKLQAVVSSH